MSSQRDLEHRAEALRALGRITAGVAHDMRNVLNAVSLQIQVLKRSAAGGDPRVAKSTECIARELRLGVALLERVSDFGRAEPSRGMLPLQLDQIALEALELARVHTPPANAAKSDLRGDLHAPPCIVGDHAELVTAVLNVLLNAIDATRDGAPVEVRTGTEHRRAWLAVVDHGQGMQPAVKRHMFEEFFTTKGSHGSGLGLTSVAACMARHGGTVRVDSTLGRGTTVALFFPCAFGRLGRQLVGNGSRVEPGGFDSSVP